MLPIFTFYELQSLDFAVFGSYKSFLQSKMLCVTFLSIGKDGKALNTAIDAVNLRKDYSKTFVAPGITKGFRKTGIWDFD